MRGVKDIMGMPVAVEVVGEAKPALDAVFEYFTQVDERFSTYKPESEISKINRGEIAEHAYSDKMREIFALAEATKQETGGYFSITRPDGTIDPSGIVKGWAIRNAARLVERMGHTNYFIDVGGDIQSHGVDERDEAWTVGIRNPFDRTQIVKAVRPEGRGIATSGTYIRGQHIYDPHEPGRTIEDIVSLTVIGPDVYEADRFATAAFAMGRRGIALIEGLPGFEGYQIDREGIATMTSGFTQLLA